MSVEVSPAAYALGPYVLGRRIGLGGMGEVFVAMREGGGPPVALKLLLDHLAAERRAVEMFLHEAELVARIRHPNIVRIVDVGTCEGRHFLAMELVHGVPLDLLIDALARTRTPVAPGVLLHIARGLFEGLHYAHTLRDERGRALGVVHRDVSPQNVMVSVDGEVKITDFGIAQAHSSPHYTQPGHVRGKCEYLAPEQIRARRVDARADVFAAALTLAHLATGKSVFSRDDIASTMRAVVHEPFPELRRFRSDLDARFTAVLARAASKDPLARFQTARDACDALPKAPPRSAAELAALVQRLCEADLDATVEATRELTTRTSQSRRTLVPDTELSPVPGRAPRQLRRLAVAAVLVGAACAWALVRTAATEPGRPLSSAEATIAPVLHSDDELPALPAAPARAEAPPPRARPRPKPAPETGLGFLTVDALPWADVFIDGRRVGQTPLAELPLLTGRQRVSLKNPDTGVELERTITIRRGQELTLRGDLR